MYVSSGMYNAYVIDKHLHFIDFLSVNRIICETKRSLHCKINWAQMVVTLCKLNNITNFTFSDITAILLFFIDFMVDGSYRY